MVEIYKICDTVFKVMRPIFHYIPPIYCPQTLLPTLRITRFNPQFSVRFVSIFSFLCNVCRSLLVFLSFFIWPLYCLSFDLRILITSLISLKFSSIQSLFSEYFDFEHTLCRLFKRRVVHT